MTSPYTRFVRDSYSYYRDHELGDTMEHMTGNLTVREMLAILSDTECPETWTEFSMTVIVEDCDGTPDKVYSFLHELMCHLVAFALTGVQPRRAINEHRGSSDVP